MKYLLALCLSACTPQEFQPVAHYPSYSLTVDETAIDFKDTSVAIVRAFRERAPGLFVDYGAAVITVKKADATDSAKWGNIVGYANEDGPGEFSILLRDTVSPFAGTRTHNLIIHEIGHCLGLTHSLDVDNVMYQSLQSSASIEVSVGQIIKALVDKVLLKKDKVQS